MAVFIVLELVEKILNLYKIHWKDFRGLKISKKFKALNKVELYIANYII